jgi:hypothetical protein
VTGWLSRTTLDIIGEGQCGALVRLCVVVIILILILAGFGFQFGSLDNIKTPLRDQLENLL